MQERNPLGQSGQFERAIRRVLRPLVRVLIFQNITVTALYRIVKQTYVDVATEMLGADTTDSRISVMTGVHRRDVKEMRSQTADGDKAERRKMSTLSTVVGRWLSSADYTDADGHPITIPRAAETGASFEALVQSVSRDVRPRTVLDELARQGILVVDGESVRLVLDGVVGPADLDQRLYFFAQNLGDHMTAAVDNIVAETPPHLERAVFYNALDDAALGEIEAEVRDLGTDMLRRVNSKAASLQSESADDPAARNRFRFGIFFYSENERGETNGRDTDEDR